MTTTSLDKYEAFFGRPADFVLEARSEDTPAISVARFPLVHAGFFRRFRTPVHDRFVYITHGMSSQPMKVPPDQAKIYPAFIELIAYSEGVYAGAHDGTDLVTLCLQALATMPFHNDMFLGPMHTAALEEPIAQGSEMSAFFFAVPEGVEMSRLCSCTPAAQLVVSVIPITTSERAYAVANGPERFLGLLGEHRVPNLFNPFRHSIM
jgi:hypothetical protein